MLLSKNQINKHLVLPSFSSNILVLLENGDNPTTEVVHIYFIILDKNVSFYKINHYYGYQQPTMKKKGSV